MLTEVSVECNKTLWRPGLCIKPRWGEEGAYSASQTTYLMGRGSVPLPRTSATGVSLSGLELLLFMSLQILVGQGGQRWCLGEASKSNFDLLWPWPLTSWPSKLIFSCLCHVHHLCQLFASESLESFSKYCDHKFGDELAGKNIRNIVPGGILDWRRHNNREWQVAPPSECHYTGSRRRAAYFRFLNGCL